MAEPRLVPNQWRSCEEYLEGIRLFNAGQHWHAHEAWERLWHAEGRQGAVADFLKALIKLAAAAVKARAGIAPGFTGHAARAAGLLEQARLHFGDNLCGLDLPPLIEHARRWGSDPQAAAEILTYRISLEDFPFQS
jgi:hypothetical protein